MPPKARTLSHVFQHLRSCHLHARIIPKGFPLPATRSFRSSSLSMSASSEETSKPLPIGTPLHGRAGRIYSIDEVLASRHVSLSVYRASANGENFIVKHMIPGEFEYQQDLQRSLASCPNLRTYIDTVPEIEALLYRFLTSDLFRVKKDRLPEVTRKHILKSALTGLRDLHGKGIIHSDIKPNNILLDYEETSGSNVHIQSIQISDLEDAVLLPAGKNLKGCLCGNQLWRSPESWARARQNTPSDIFSFAILAVYLMLEDTIFLVSKEELASEDAWRYILLRHISFFGDEDGFKGLLYHIGEDNPFFERLITLAGNLNAENPRKPFVLWHYVDKDFRDLISKMTNLDPAKRITAQEALEHSWFW